MLLKNAKAHRIPSVITADGVQSEKTVPGKDDEFIAGRQFLVDAGKVVPDHNGFDRHIQVFSDGVNAVAFLNRICGVFLFDMPLIQQVLVAPGKSVGCPFGNKNAVTTGGRS